MAALTPRDAYLRRTYGITLAQYEALLALQDGACAVCKRPPGLKADGSPKSLHVDHNHATGVVRGLLCFPCNSHLIARHKDPQLFRHAAEYLESSPAVALLGEVVAPKRPRRFKASGKRVAKRTAKRAPAKRAARKRAPAKRARA